MPNKILVTGSSGFIGTNLVKELRGRGHEVWGCDLKNCEDEQFIRCDVREYRQLERIFDREFFEYVFHLAAEYGRWNGEGFYEQLWETNVIGTKNLIRLQEKLKFRTIFFSSAEVYADYTEKMVEDVMDTVPLKQLNDYAMSKWVGEMQFLNSANMFGTETVRIRPVNCFSGDTNVMTPNGIKNIKDFKVGDKVYTLNPNTIEVEEDIVVDTISSKTNEIVSMKNKKINWRITKDHNMYCSVNQSKYKFIKAEDIVNKGQVDIIRHKPMMGGIDAKYMNFLDWVDADHIVCLKPTKVDVNRYEDNGLSLCNIDKFIEHNQCEIFIKDMAKSRHHYPAKVPMTTFLRLLAWYITEGSVSHDEYAKITIQQQGKYRDEIISTIREMGLRPTIGKRYIAFHSRVFRNLLYYYKLVGSENKSIPEFVFGLNYSLRNEFLNTLMKGDGDDNWEKYSSVSLSLAEGVNRLLFSCGKESTIVLEYGKNKPIYRVRINGKRGNCRSIEKGSMWIEQVNNEDVYCITAKKNHIIYAGRGGFLGWIGQCYGPEEHYTPYRGVIPVFIWKVLHNKPYTVYNGHKRIFDYVGDTVRTIANIVDNFIPGEVYNVGSDENWEVEIKYISDLILRHLKKDDSQVTYKEAEPFTTVVKHMDFAKIRKDLNHEAKVTIEEGIPRTIEWFKKVYR